jgi:hypothetical protein
MEVINATRILPKKADSSTMIMKQKATVDALVIAPNFKVSAVVEKIAATKTMLCPNLMTADRYLGRIFKGKDLPKKVLTALLIIITETQQEPKIICAGICSPPVTGH